MINRAYFHHIDREFSRTHINALRNIRVEKNAVVLQIMLRMKEFLELAGGYDHAA